MLWSDFVTEVNAQISVDANRRGLEAFRDRFIRNAVLDLQRYIPGYRQGLTTTYGINDVTALDLCSLVQMPAGALPKEIWLYSTDPAADPYCKRYRLDFYPWKSRQDLICGKLDFMNWWSGGWWPNGVCPTPPATIQPNCNGWNWCEKKGYVYTMAPHGKSFLVYPQISSTNALILLWDGYKTEFLNGDTIPFHEGASEAVASYLKWRISLEVDKNIPLAREFQAAWRERRLSLYRDWQDTQDAEGDGDEYGNGSITPPPQGTFQSGTVPLTQGMTTVAVTFPSGYNVVPIVDCWIVGPSGAAFAISAFPDGSSISLTGFNAIFAGAIPDNSGYVLNWNAMLAT